MGRERRTDTRYEMELPVFYDGSWAKTSDVSASGVRFEAADQMEPGRQIHFQLQFRETWKQTVAVCAGRVIRTDAVASKYFVAATIDSIAFEPSRMSM